MPAAFASLQAAQRCSRKLWQLVVLPTLAISGAVAASTQRLSEKQPSPPPTKPHNKNHKVCAASKNVEDINASLGKLIKQAAANQASRKTLLTRSDGLPSKYIAAAAAAFADGKLKGGKAPAAAAPKKK